MSETEFQKRVAARADVFFLEQQNAVWSRTSRLFGWLLLGQWIAAIVVAVVLSPYSWEGDSRSVHMHVWTAVILGGTLVALPVYWAFSRPTTTGTRHCVAIGQMLMSALLIHLTGGRIETHFHVFGSLAFLSFYRDWRVLITASGVVVADHVLGGIFFPISVYGVSAIEPFRWLEHAWWVIFEDLFLIKACRANVKEMHNIAFRQAELLETRALIEVIVDERTAQLQDSKITTATLYLVSRFLNQSRSLTDAGPKILRAIRRGFLASWGQASGAVFEVQGSGSITPIFQFQLAEGSNGARDKQAVINPVLCERVLLEGSIVYDDTAGNLPARSDGKPVAAVLAFPLLVGDKVNGIVELHLDQEHQLTAEDRSLLESIGRHLGQFIVRRKAEAQNVRLAQIVQSSNDAIVYENLNGEIMSWNRGAERIFGYTADDVKGKPVSLLIPHCNGSTSEKLALANTKTDNSEHEEVGARKNGTAVAVALTRSPVVDEQGDIIGNSIIMRDITERKEAEKRVSEFYSVVSHELRTPLTAVRGALGLIEGGIVEHGSDECLDLIMVARQSADRLIRLINDMLDLKKLEAGKIELDLISLSPRDVVQASIEGISAMADEAGVLITSEVTTSCRFLGDYDRVIQILTNLVSNAIKFSRAGGTVAINAQRIDGSVRFAVTDEGCGIPSHEVHKLFGKFQQLDSSDTRQKGGSGLGLSICKALVEQHGGTIGLHSEVDKGSTFYFDLPIKAEGKSADDDKQWAVLIADAQSAMKAKACSSAEPEKMEAGGAPKVLIADDDADVRTIMRKQLQALGFETLEAQDGVAAISVVRTQSPDLIILDVGMPYVDGFKVVEVLSEEQASSTPLIIYTGRDLTSSERSQLKLGHTRYITKSGVSATQVTDVVKELMSVRESGLPRQTCAVG